MPCSWVTVFVRVHKGNSRWKLVVVFYKVGEVNIGFAPFIPCSMQRPSVVVDRIHGALPPVIRVSLLHGRIQGAEKTHVGSFSTQDVSSLWSFPITTIWSKELELVSVAEGCSAVAVAEISSRNVAVASMRPSSVADVEASWTSIDSSSSLPMSDLKFEP